MNRLADEKEIVKLEKTLKKHFSEEKIGELRALSIAQLDLELMKLSKERESEISAQKRDDELEKARQVVKELNAPYKESLKKNKLLSRFVALILEERV